MHSFIRFDESWFNIYCVFSIMRNAKATGELIVRLGRLYSERWYARYLNRHKEQVFRGGGLKRAEFKEGFNSLGRIFEGIGLELYLKWWVGHRMARMGEAEGKSEESCIAMDIDAITIVTTTLMSITSAS